MFGHVSIRQVSPGGSGADGTTPTVSERLFRAALEVLIRDGSDRLTVRRVAAEAGLAVATAYAYLGSKDQLLAEIARRSISEGAATGDGRSTAGRTDSRADPGTADPLYAAPGSPFSVADVRTRIAPDIRRRVCEAMGSGVSPARAEALEALYSSAVLGAGVGYSLHTGAGSVEQVANRILRR
ncbi:putative transcriptional regulator, TetR family [Nocardia nova SH22a]|uniref:Putative transcriptional regulator, TetR family n=1 Tax=Nocardia nova SH22a TaxID=1415166 RepID=W5TKM7_9NOCA|nr:putative transcriptional regulator, TetR family [Nocardia nova SH22a]